MSFIKKSSVEKVIGLAVSIAIATVIAPIFGGLISTVRSKLGI